MSYTTRKVAAPYTLEHRVYIEKDGVPVSPFHDIPLFANQEKTILNMIVEIPRWTNAKLEVSELPRTVACCGRRDVSTPPSSKTTEAPLLRVGQTLLRGAVR